MQLDDVIKIQVLTETVKIPSTKHPARKTAGKQISNKFQ
jgi:hypothetical protein